MRILVTNDDGINAPGLVVMEEIARDLAGQGGQVYTVAPAFEQSGVAHLTSHARPCLISKLASGRYAMEGAPADCVLAGIHDVLDGDAPDLILSGVNRGNNSAENAVYSGTLGAAMEGALQGVPAVALSQYFGPANVGLDTPFEAAARHGARLLRKLLSVADWGTDGSYRTFYNVNFPPVAADDVKGIRVAKQGLRQNAGFKMVPQNAPSGRRFLWVQGAPQNGPVSADSDAEANLAGYISVTPMRADLTAHDALPALAAALAD